MTNVLLDRHHGGLFHSLQLLGARLGWTVYTPKGMDWWHAGIWNFGRYTYPDDRLAQQYLVGAAFSPDEEFPDAPIAFVTLGEARGMRWDYVVATLQDNQAGFARFARETGARYVYQVGNTGQQIDWSLDPLVLNSSEMPLLGRGIQYHQEFDHRGTFGFREPTDSHAIRCFVHLLPEMADPRCWPAWLAMRDAMPDFEFTRYGHAPSFDDPSYGGSIKPIGRIADLMADSAWGWQDKAQGDGFGHVLHGWAAVGRPLIGHASHYRGKMGAVFWRDLETCIDLDRHPEQEAVELIRAITGTERHREMCRAIRTVVDEQLDYDAEAEQIRDLLSDRVTLVPGVRYYATRR